MNLYFLLPSSRNVYNLLHSMALSLKSNFTTSYDIIFLLLPFMNMSILLQPFMHICIIILKSTTCMNLNSFLKSSWRLYALLQTFMNFYNLLQPFMNLYELILPFMIFLNLFKYHISNKISMNIQHSSSFCKLLT